MIQGDYETWKGNMGVFMDALSIYFHDNSEADYIMKLIPLCGDKNCLNCFFILGFYSIFLTGMHVFEVTNK